MISVESIGYVERLLATREVKEFYLDVFTLVLDPSKRDYYADANRGYYYLLTHELPQGTTIASETAILQVDENWPSRGITKIQEFGGQLAIHLPSPGALSQVEFIRAIPRT